jgi:phthiocerol/phenolphthiocerol synthesis type-I polyketide synthase E
MTELSKRIAYLSPEKRKLFEQLLKEKALPHPVQIPEPLASPLLTCGAESTSQVPEGRAEPQDGQLTFELNSSPAEVKANYRRFYNAVSEQLDSTVFGQFSFFLNYGYVPDLNPQYATVELPAHYLNKNSIKLVIEVIGDCVLTDCRVLDVGCGRGGTVYVLHQFFGAKAITGLDLSSTAIAFCKANHRYVGVKFYEGDAERLPFEDEAFEVVTNIESSHSYPNIYAFYSEVFRVLTSGGYFLYTDAMPVERMSDYVTFLEELGFIVERDRDITTNVLLSCDEIARTRVQAYDRHNDPQLMQDFLGMPGSAIYEEMSKRRWTYRIFKLRKPAVLSIT